MTMDTVEDIEVVEPPPSCNQNIEIEKDFEKILHFLSNKEEVSFKSQQRGEADLTQEEKSKLGLQLFNKNKLQFLLKFGEYLLPDHLQYFKKFTENNEDSEEIGIILENLVEKSESNKKSYNVKNRRFEALQQMICEGDYFSEIEMMKRNPLLYEKLVGQYLTAEEIRERDKYSTSDQSSFVKILLEGIEREDAVKKRKDQESFEESVMEENDSDSDDSMKDSERSRSPLTKRELWGEFENENIREKPKSQNLNITVQERNLLKEEFITTMYQSFLNGCDEDFDYKTVDSNEKFDNVEILEHDAEDKYFDSEEPEDAPPIKDSVSEDASEDELDIFMSALNENPTVKQLTCDMTKVNTIDD